jgi:hypothetical protein
MELDRRQDRLIVHAARYRLEVDAAQPIATLVDTAGSRPMRLMLLTALDSNLGPDGTLAVAAPAVTAGGEASCTITIDAVSTTWVTKQLRIACREDEVAFETAVTGSGRLSDVRLLGGPYSGNPRWGGGLFHSSWGARTLFDPSPDDPRRIVAPAAEPATIGVVGSSMPGRGHWFFTPAPFVLAGSAAETADPDDPATAPWTTLELRAGIERLTFTELRYAPVSDGFSLVLSYNGQTSVDGDFTTPALVIRPCVDDPYTAVADHAARLRGAGLAPRVRRTPPSWWSRPIFCGWGEQCRQAGLEGVHATTLSRRDRYDGWLATLADNDVRPGTITIDDKWQTTYGRNEVDTDRWPDLRGWVADRHDAAQRVLLWFKAWDPEGLPAEACITDRLGNRVAADPDAPAYRAIVQEALDHLLGAEGIDADGLKIDFTAQTPSGPGLTHAGDAWGVALLHRLLALIHRSAKRAKPDALIVTHTPSPLFSDVTDMVRLNDLLRLEDPEPFAAAVPQMRHRARIAAAADPGWLIDTDDWCMPSRAEWRAYLAAKPELGVPALYYATGIDHSGEPFDADDYAAIREAWARWEARGMRERHP